MQNQDVRNIPAVLKQEVQSEQQEVQSEQQEVQSEQQEVRRTTAKQYKNGNYVATLSPDRWRRSCVRKSSWSSAGPRCSNSSRGSSISSAASSANSSLG